MRNNYTQIGKVSNFTTSLFSPLQASGVPFERLLGKSKLGDFNLTDQENYIPLPLAYDFILDIYRYIGPSAFKATLRSGFNNFRLEDLGDYANHILSYPNLLKFLQEVVKYDYVMLSSIKMDLVITGHETRMCAVFTDPPTTGRNIMILSKILQSIQGIRIFAGASWLPHLEVPNSILKSIESHFPIHASISGGHPHVALVFDTKLLRKENPFINEFMVRDLPDPSKHISIHMENILKSLKPGYMASVEDFSYYFNISTRTIRRRLFAEGTSFSELRERSTFLTAINLLNNTNWKVKEIAEYLGYNETANFIRFFNRKVGASPTVFRKHSKLAANDNFLT